MKEFHSAYLDKDWEELTRCELGAMSQGNESFWDFAIRVQAKNSLLTGTNSHLSSERLCHRIESGMDEGLACWCVKAKVNQIEEFKEWLNEIKDVDDLLRADWCEFEQIAQSCWELTRRLPFDPTMRNNVAGSSSHPFTGNKHVVGPRLPKLTETKCKLLWDNEGCFQCRKFFAGHLSKGCTGDLPDPTSYKTLTNTDIERAKQTHRKGTVAVVTSHEEGMDYGSDGNELIHPIAAVAHPGHPAAYLPSNSSLILGTESPDGSEEENEEVSCHLSSPAQNETAKTAPLRQQHLWWTRELVSEDPSVPTSYHRSLIDNGSYSVLIREHEVCTACLKKHKLEKPETIEVAITDDGKKSEILLHEFVLLSLVDPCMKWKAKKFCAIVAPNLCSPVILGLPFLKHNKVVIDHELQTVVPKGTRVNLADKDTSHRPKMTWKEEARMVRGNREATLRELKGKCEMRQRQVDESCEHVKPINYVALIKQCLEVLSAQ
jgi:hypothetical protein